ncbi:unnamed protein product [Candida verbasci]|uniref:Ubiquitin-like domain-containing protein n=1 Tax=Candida verbasci TaxID=1227364 RepID=A0A9W4TV33_9ASCO|nr:unnamed protein product [Candida verbasci]
MSDNESTPPIVNNNNNNNNNNSSSSSNLPQESESGNAGVKDEKPDTTHINLKVSDGSAEIFFKIKRNTPLRRLMEAFCKRQGKDMNALRFLSEGQRILAEQTPNDLDLEDGDTIEAHRAQTGGR